MKKFLSILMAMMLVLGMMGAAFADDTTTTTITATDNGHTYQVFQVFTADYSEDVLSNVKWGQNCVSGYTQGTAVDAAILEDLTAKATGSDVEKRDAVLKYVNLKGTPVAELKKDALTASVPTGYYVIVDKANTVPDNGSYTLALVQIAGAVTISPKAAVPSFTKKIKDTNDSITNETNVWQDSADYDIGDDVPYLLTGTVAADYDNYKTYKFVFHDTLEAGKLSFNADSVIVKIDGTVVTEGYTVTTTGNNKFDVVFENLKLISAVHQSSVITVEFTAKLLEGANIGKTGNLNTAYLEFSNNPNWDVDTDEGEEPTGKTVEDTVIVFTYKVEVNKVDKDGNALPGAEFALSKKVGEAWVVKQLVKNTEGTTFSFTGLDDGEYKLEETKTPAGKNSIASPIFFTVAANHVDVKADLDNNNRETVLTSLTGSTATGTVGTYTFAADANLGTLSTNVVNLSGATLPETGGIGTTIFYLLGSIMFVGAAMTLVVRRRAEAEEV